MPNVDRSQLMRAVYSRLTDPVFRQRLTSESEDGSRPIIASLPSDRVSDLFDHLRAAGGAANVAFPMLNGLCIAAVQMDDGDLQFPSETDETAPLLRSDCTVAVLFERLRLDLAAAGGDMTYRFHVEGPDQRSDGASAAVVAVAG